MALKIEFKENEIVDYLRVDPGLEDVTINQMKAEAMDEAEGFLNTDFEGKEAPAAVKGWVLNRIAEKFENRGQEPEPDFSAMKRHRVFPFRG